MEVELE